MATGGVWKRVQGKGQGVEGEGVKVGLGDVKGVRAGQDVGLGRCWGARPRASFLPPSHSVASSLVP